MMAWHMAGEYFFQEMHGMADATGLSYDMVRRVHMLGELTKGSMTVLDRH